MRSETSQETSSDDFYVGYLPVPRAQRAKLWLIVPAMVLALGLAGFAIGRSQHGAGPAVWDTSRVVERTGVLIESPYPMIMIDEGAAGPARTILLVQSSKRGAQPRVKGLDGQRVVAKGYTLRRESGGRVTEMLELSDEADALVSLGEGALPEEQPLGPVTLIGEIVDSKCYHGAMKPGEGKTHKACATLCVRGGIPPSLIVWDEAVRVPTVLASAEGGPIETQWLAYVGEMVEVRGQASLRAGVRILRIDSITRQ